MRVETGISYLISRTETMKVETTKISSSLVGLRQSEYPTSLVGLRQSEYPTSLVGLRQKVRPQGLHLAGQLSPPRGHQPKEKKI